MMSLGGFILSSRGLPALRRLADVLNVSGDDWLESAETAAANARLEGRERLRQFQEVELLPAEAECETGTGREVRALPG